MAEHPGRTQDEQIRNAQQAPAKTPSPAKRLSAEDVERKRITALRKTYIAHRKAV